MTWKWTAMEKRKHRARLCRLCVCVCVCRFSMGGAFRLFRGVYLLVERGRIHEGNDHARWDHCDGTNTRNLPGRILILFRPFYMTSTSGLVGVFSTNATRVGIFTEAPDQALHHSLAIIAYFFFSNTHRPLPTPHRASFHPNGWGMAARLHTVNKSTSMDISSPWMSVFPLLGVYRTVWLEFSDVGGGRHGGSFCMDEYAALGFNLLLVTGGRGAFHLSTGIMVAQPSLRGFVQGLWTTDSDDGGGKEKSCGPLLLEAATRHGS